MITKHTHNKFVIDQRIFHNFTKIANTTLIFTNKKKMFLINQHDYLKYYEISLISKHETSKKKKLKCNKLLKLLTFVLVQLISLDSKESTIFTFYNNFLSSLHCFTPPEYYFRMFLLSFFLGFKLHLSFLYHKYNLHNRHVFA